MIVNRTHVRWGVGTFIASLVVVLLCLANNDPDLLKRWHIGFPLPEFLGPVPPLRGNIGATPLGLIYGTIALLIFIFAALLGWRRSRKTLPLGPIQTWLKAHIWLTILTIPLVICHCGLHGGGPMTQFLLWLYAFVMLSGFWGLTLQNIVPKLMQEYLPEETIFEQIPYIRGKLEEETKSIREEIQRAPEDAAQTVEGHDGGVATAVARELGAVKTAISFIDEEALPYLKSLKSRHFALHDRTASDNQFRLLRLQMPASIQPLIDRLHEICDEKRRLDLQTRLHYWLHGWLIVHAPASILLVVLTVVHAIVATFIYA